LWTTPPIIDLIVKRIHKQLETMAALSADAKIMADLLAALTHPDTNAIRQAEAALKPLLKKPACVPVLVEVINARETLVRSARLDFLKFWDLVCRVHVVGSLVALDLQILWFLSFETANTSLSSSSS
jgi:hypothetical protein